MSGRGTPESSPDDPVIELRGVSVQYRAQAEPTLVNIDLTVLRGEKIAVVGASGSGKSTLLSLINGLIPHRHSGTVTGSVQVCGADPGEVPLVETARHVGTVLQDTSAQFVGLSVAEDVAFSLENQQVPHGEIPERVRRATERAGIQDRLDASPQELSGGQKQRVAIAGVLVDDVEVLLFDEPLAMLDPATGRSAVELIDELHREQGATIMIVEHRLEDLLHRDVDRIVLMSDGRIIVDAPPDEVLASGILEEHGIRPPLHVTALRYAGASVDASQRPSRAERLELRAEQVASVREWAAQEDVTAPSLPPARETALDLDAVGLVVPGPAGTGREVLSDISIEVGRGEMIGVIGSNGAGKSTLARIVCGFITGATGIVRIGGQDASSWSLAARGEHIGFVLQEPGQMISRPLLADEIALGLRARGFSQGEIERRTAHVLEVCGLRPFRTWPVSALSHGQRKRLTIASVLALSPEVLILDEPTAGQDFGHYTEFMDLVAQINAEGTTVVLITHDMHLALEYTDRVIVLTEGRLLADAHPSDVLTDPAITDRADLVTTGLFELARRCGITDAPAFVRRFVDVDRSVRSRRAG